MNNSKKLSSPVFVLASLVCVAVLVSLAFDVPPLEFALPACLVLVVGMLILWPDDPHAPRNAEAVQLLRQLDRYMRGNETWEHGAFRHWQDDTGSPAFAVREFLARADDPQGHEPHCLLRVAASCPVGVECEHGRIVCPDCDPCTCKPVLSHPFMVGHPPYVGENEAMHAPDVRLCFHPELAASLAQKCPTILRPVAPVDPAKVPGGAIC